MSRIDVRKTYKLYIGGQFPRDGHGTPGPLERVVRVDQENAVIGHRLGVAVADLHAAHSARLLEIGLGLGALGTRAIIGSFESSNAVDMKLKTS